VNELDNMFKALKLMHLAGALKSKGNAQEAYSAVLELGRLGHEKAVDLLIEAMARRDGVARSAARELGKLGNDRAIPPLIRLLGNAEVNQAAAEALLAFGTKAVNPLIETLKDGNGDARQAAAFALGEIRDKQAVEPLVMVMQTDDVYAVRTAAATALGNLKDARAVWVLVATLQMRDETTPERQASLEQLRHATTLAMRKIGDPLVNKTALGSMTADAQAAVQQVEQAVAEKGAHPKLAGDLKLLKNDELIEVAKELIASSEEISWAKLENREPMLPPYFIDYEQRAGAAEKVGRELHRRGGTTLLKQVLEEQLGNHTAISNWWSGIETP
jgi:HEAT repeat protein